MTLFIILCSVMCLVSMFWIYRTLSANSSLQQGQAESLNIEVARQRELEIQHYTIDELSSDDQSLREIEASLLDDVTLSERIDETSTTSPKWHWVIICCIPFFALLIYLQLGSPITLTDQFIAEQQQSNEQGVPSLAVIIQKLEDHVLESPGDAQSWTVLAKAYMGAQLYEKAANAYTQAHHIMGENPEIMTSLADALLMTNQYQVTPQVTSLLKRALELDPININARWISALSLESMGELETSLTHYQILFELLADQPTLLTEVNHAAERVKLKLNESGALSQDQSVQESSNESESENHSSTLSVNVGISEELESQFEGSEIVYIVAKAIKGSPMPVAAVKVSVADLPFNVVLSDENAMTPMAKLSQHNRVSVIARVSMSGDPIPQSGDYQSERLDIDLNEKSVVNLTIREIVK